MNYLITNLIHLYSSPWNVIIVFFVIYYSYVIVLVESNPFLVRYIFSLITIFVMYIHIISIHRIVG